MSLPPSTIRIKRKLDEAPVRALYVDRSETKRQKVKKDFVFRLARTVTSPTDPNPPPFQPQPFSRPASGGIPQVRSTLTPASRSRQVSPTLVSRTPSPHHAIGPLPAGSKLALDTDIGLRRTNKSRVPLSAIARADSYVSVAGTESLPVLAPETEPTTEPATSLAPRPESSGSDGPVRQGTFGSEKQHSLSGGETGTNTKPIPSPSTTTSKRKAAAAVRRYHLAKRLRIKHPHPYSTAVTRRSAIFVRAPSEPLAGEGLEADVEMDKLLPEEPEESTAIQKRPRTHPEEKRRIEEERRTAEEGRLRLQAEKDAEEQNRKVRFSAPERDVDPMTLAMENMVLEYLNSPENAGMRNLPSAASPRRGTPVKSALQQRIGGGLGGGSWKEMDRKGEIDEELEAEEGFVYDVYIREELKEYDGKKEDEDYGLIVINGSDDEEWWYEGDEEVDSDDVYGSDDDDSNAEDYHTNDYPEEPLYDSDADGIDEFGVLGDSDDEDSDDDDSDYENDGGMFRNWKKPVRGGEEEYDLEYDEDVDVEAEGIRRKMAELWGYKEGQGGASESKGEGEGASAPGDGGDEMED